VIIDAIRKVVDGRHLTEEEAIDAMTTIMNGEATIAQIASLITALRMKGETVDEITGFVRVMRDKSIKVHTSRTPLVDTCGTGGDRLNTFNISTTAAFVVAGAGIAVAKHGNRAASSKCGSADVLEALGVKIGLSAEQVGKCIDECGIGFMFAPMLHPAMKHAVGPRKEIGIRTVFNILGPMTNPASAKYQVIGVFTPHLCKLMAEVLANLGSERAMVVHGEGGLDEISTFGVTTLAEVLGGEVKLRNITPSDFGFNPSTVSQIVGADSPNENARVLLSILSGEKGPARDIVLANASAALLVAGKASTFVEGVALSAESIDTGAAKAALERLKYFTEEYCQ
jgi:anthranilate phosphoribosyltransferase